jgi:hypothetical protein
MCDPGHGLAPSIAERYEHFPRRLLCERFECEPVIPSKSNRTLPIEYDRQAYKRWNLIERCQRPQTVSTHRDPLRENRKGVPLHAMHRGGKALDQNCQHGLIYIYIVYLDVAN